MCLAFKFAKSVVITGFRLQLSELMLWVLTLQRREDPVPLNIAVVSTEMSPLDTNVMFAEKQMVEARPKVCEHTRYCHHEIELKKKVHIDTRGKIICCNYQWGTTFFFSNIRIYPIYTKSRLSHFGKKFSDSDESLYCYNVASFSEVITFALRLQIPTGINSRARLPVFYPHQNALIALNALIPRNWLKNNPHLKNIIENPIPPGFPTETYTKNGHVVRVPSAHKGPRNHKA